MNVRILALIDFSIINEWNKDHQDLFKGTSKIPSRQIDIITLHMAL